MSQQILEQVLGRSNSLFREDMESSRDQLLEKITGTRMLVIGAAGSIGSSFIKQLLVFNPGTLHLVDPAENNLVELVRDLRSSDLKIPRKFKTLSIPMGSVAFTRFLESEHPYDYVVNFSALKHVRGERDPFSLMHMLEVNVLAWERTLRTLAFESGTKVFSVSSDKAVNPANLMGASKAIMERILFSFSEQIPYTTSRFANVAFSDGGLLHGFCRRFEKGPPFSAPNDVRRYFISYEESGQLCLLACFLGANRDIFIPRLDPKSDLKSFSQIAKLFLQSKGFTAKEFSSDVEARKFAADRDHNSKEWPCYFSGSDTSGEKPVEEFVGLGEKVDFSKFKSVGVIVSQPPQDDAFLAQTLSALEDMQNIAQWSVADIAEAMQIMVPELEHRIMTRNLDQKM